MAEPGDQVSSYAAYKSWGFWEPRVASYHLQHTAFLPIRFLLIKTILTGFSENEEVFNLKNGLWCLTDLGLSWWLFGWLAVPSLFTCLWSGSQTTWHIVQLERLNGTVVEDLGPLDTRANMMSSYYSEGFYYLEPFCVFVYMLSVAKVMAPFYFWVVAEIMWLSK